MIVRGMKDHYMGDKGFYSIPCRGFRVWALNFRVGGNEHTEMNRVFLGSYYKPWPNPLNSILQTLEFAIRISGFWCFKVLGWFWDLMVFGFRASGTNPRRMHVPSMDFPVVGLRVLGVGFREYQGFCHLRRLYD